MAVPKRKTSKSRRNMRRSHHALKIIHPVTDKQTGELHPPHCISPSGWYKEKKVTGN